MDDLHIYNIQKRNGMNRKVGWIFAMVLGLYTKIQKYKIPELATYLQYTYKPKKSKFHPSDEYKKAQRAKIRLEEWNEQKSMDE